MNMLAREDGFTLIEVITALAILVLVVASFAALFTTSNASIFYAGEKSKALAIAQGIMEGLKQLPHEQLVLYSPFQEGVKDGYRWQLYLEPAEIAFAQDFIGGTIVTVVVYYLESNYKVKLSSFVKGPTVYD